MTLLNYFVCVLMFVLGQALHLFIIKIPSIKKRANTTNKGFVFKEWWAEDWNIIVGTQVIGALAIFGLDELVNFKPEIVDYIRWFFAAVGAFGSTFVMAKFSNYEKKILGLMDIQANVFDAVAGHANNREEAIEKGKAATGIDVTIPPPPTK